MFLQLCAMWPTADIFTAVYDPDGTEGRFADRTVHSSFLQRVRPTARTFRALLPLYPSAIESFDLSGYDLVISSSSAWAHAVRCPEDTVHVSYCHNPFRYAWNDRDSTLARRNPIARAFLRSAFRRWRQWDWAAAQRTTRYVANSVITQARRPLARVRVSVLATASTSRWGTTTTSARDSLAPSMIEAWFRASETITSSGPARALTVPRFVA